MQIGPSASIDGPCNSDTNYIHIYRPFFSFFFFFVLSLTYYIENNVRAFYCIQRAYFHYLPFKKCVQQLHKFTEISVNIRFMRIFSNRNVHWLVQQILFELLISSF